MSLSKLDSRRTKEGFLKGILGTGVYKQKARAVLFFFCPHWPGSAPSRPLAVVKRLMGDEPSVIRVDFSPSA